MPHPKKSHEGKLQIVCCLCLRKADRTVTPSQERLIQAYVFQGYSSCVLPSGLCNGCGIRLTSFNGTSSQAFRIHLNYSQMAKDMQKISRATRNNPNCHCEICRLASSTSSTKAVRVETNKYFLAGGGVQGHGQPSKYREDSPTVACSLCLSQLGKGKAHYCSPKTSLMNLQQSLSPTTKDKITGGNIRKRRMEG